MEPSNQPPPPQAPPSLSIVLPAYSEEGNIERAVREAFKAAERIAADHEVVVVNDGSRDGTAGILKALLGEWGPALRSSSTRSILIPGQGFRSGLSCVSGWRPPGQEAPSVVVSAGGRSTTSRLGPGARTISLETITSGWWRSDLVVEIRSDTFEPGRGDPRRLGVRIEEARLAPLGGGLRRPPLGALLAVHPLDSSLSRPVGSENHRRSGFGAAATEATPPFWTLR